MPLATFQNLFPRTSAVGRQLASVGTSLVVANTNGKLTQANDPWAIVAGTATNHGLVRPVTIPDLGLYLDVYHLYTGNTTPTTDPIVRAHGKIRAIDPTSKNRIWPYDVDPATFTANPTNLWIPLQNPKDASETQTLTGVGALYTATGTFSVSKVGTFWVGGVEEAMVSVATAAAFADGGTRSMILARITG